MSKRIYLAGSIQFSKDLGEGWRKKIRPELEQQGWEVLDPTDKENTSEVRNNLGEFVLKKKWKRFDAIVEEIQIRDKQLVLSSDLLIVLWDTTIKMYGTADELLWARENNIPIYAVINGSLTSESYWALRKLRYAKIFPDFKKMITYMKRTKNETKS